MKSMKFTSAQCSIGLLSVLLAGPLRSGVIFTENFNSYEPGSNLNGQGSWEVDNTGGNDTVRLSMSASTLLNNGSIVVNGQETSIGNISFARHALPSALSTSAITTLTFDVYASTAVPVTHNTTVGFAKMSVGIINDIFAYWTASSDGYRWAFCAVPESNQPQADFYPGGYDKVVHLGIVIDGLAGQVYGIYDFGSGYQQTPSYTISPSTITSFDAVSFGIRYGNGGGELDNIRVQAVPESSSYAYALLAAAFLAVEARRRRNRMA